MFGRAVKEAQTTNKKKVESLNINPLHFKTCCLKNVKFFKINCQIRHLR